MNKITLIFVFMIFSIGVHAQAREQDAAVDAHKFYLGLSTGINQSTGLIGITTEYQVIDKLTVNAAIGLGSWGGKFTGGLKYYLNYPGSWAFGVGYSYATGVDDVSLELQDEFVQGQSTTQKYPINLLSASTLNVSAIKYWLVGKQKKNRFHLELGYAVPTANDRYETDAPLTNTGKTFMTWLQPGGFLLGTGFSFAL